MEQKESRVALKCDCNCAMFVVEKSVWEDSEISYNITVQDSRYDHGYAIIWGRIKSAFKILFGKPVYYSDVYIGDPAKFRDFVDRLRRLCEE